MTVDLDELKYAAELAFSTEQKVRASVVGDLLGINPDVVRRGLKKLGYTRVGDTRGSYWVPESTPLQEPVDTAEDVDQPVEIVAEPVAKPEPVVAVKSEKPLKNATKVNVDDVRSITVGDLADSYAALSKTLYLLVIDK